MRKIRFFRVVAKPGLRVQKSRLSALTVLHEIKQELVFGNNTVTVYYSHNEGIIGNNGNFPPRINGFLVHRFKD